MTTEKGDLDKGFGMRQLIIKSKIICIQYLGKIVDQSILKIRVICKGKLVNVLCALELLLYP